MTHLVEREAELSRLLALAAGARAGRGAVAFVVGEAGIGKSALLAGLTGRARDLRVATGRCDALTTRASSVRSPTSPDRWGSRAR